MSDELVSAYEATLPFALDEFQKEAIVKLERSRGVIVSAPTSSGKTMVAEYLVWRRLRAPEHLQGPPGTPADVVYTTPLKALSNQKFRDLSARYGKSNVGLVTGEHTINDAAPIVVMTTEILRNVLYDEPARVDRVGDVVLDEVHYIDDHPRGTVWEEVIIEAPRHIRLTGLSATIGNVDEVAAWMSALRGPVETVKRTERPVALEMWLAINNRIHPLFDAHGNAHRRTLELAQADEMGGGDRWRYARRAPDNDLLHVVDELRRREMLPAIYFIFSRRGCREALARCELHGIDLTNADEKERIDVAVDRRLSALDDADERRVVMAALDRRLIRRGVAMHHAGMLPYVKETVEQLFQDGVIKVVFATETLSLGLNMPARSCVISTFTKFDGTSFATLTSGELTQLMGRAGRRGIDIVGHGVILKESDVDVRDIYDAAISGEFSVDSKFAPSYAMVLSLLRTRSVAEAEELLEKSFGQFQVTRQLSHWDVRRDNLAERLSDLHRQRFRHPRVPCTERTLTQFLHASDDLTELQTLVRRARREHWQRGRGRRGGGTDPGQRYEALRRKVNAAQRRVQETPCPRCPYLAEHRAHRQQVQDIEATLHGGEAELESAKQRYRREFRALSGVLRDTGFLDGDRPTQLGLLAESLFGESALLVADAVAGGTFDGLEPEELAATLVMLMAEDRGRERPAARRHFPTPAVERRYRALRQSLARLADVEREHGVDTLRPLSLDFVQPAFEWASGVELAEIESPAGADLGDVVKAVKNLYSLLRQMEQALRRHRIGELVAATRERVERDLIRRV